MIAISHRLIDLGHQRIVLLDQHTNLTNPGPDGAAFIDELTARSITVSNYNILG